MLSDFSKRFIKYYAFRTKVRTHVSLRLPSRDEKVKEIVIKFLSSKFLTCFQIKRFFCLLLPYFR